MNQAVPQICYLNHAGFHMLGEPRFRLSEGTRIPAMVVQIENQEAVLPLRSVAREFRIDPAGPDGQMLNLIEQALDFVVCLKLGDKLPSELNGGEASWEPTESDRRIAASRVLKNLVRCVSARHGKTVVISGAGATGWEDEPQNRALLREAFAGAAAQLDDADEADVIARVTAISQEIAYIEAMRRAMARGIGSLRDKLLNMKTDDVPMSHRPTVKQVQALACRGIKEIMRRFDDADARLDDVVATLRDLPEAIADVRRHRDWLFRTNRSWAAIFNDWGAAPNRFDDFVLKAVERTYLFLAPRFMSFQEWTIVDSKMNKAQMKAQVW